MLWFRYQALDHDLVTRRMRPCQVTSALLPFFPCRFCKDLAFALPHDISLVLTDPIRPSQAVFVGLAADRKLNGWPCSCGPIGRPPGGGFGRLVMFGCMETQANCPAMGGDADTRGNWLWAIYTRQDRYIYISYNII